jgi:hypothetical protein
MTKKKSLRLRKLIHPRLQLRLILTFTGLVLLALVFQFVLFTSVMSETLEASGGAFSEHFASVAAAFRSVLLISLGVVLPRTAMVGILCTAKIVGPLYNNTNFLRRSLAGARPRECRRRSDDEYQDLCALVNQVTVHLREPATTAAHEAAGAHPDPAAALPAQDAPHLHGSPRT